MELYSYFNHSMDLLNSHCICMFGACQARPFTGLDLGFNPSPPRDYLPQVMTRAIAAANSIAVVSHPMMLMPRLLTRLPITFVLLAISSISTNNGGAKKPLITAVQKSASIGLIPKKLIS